MHRAVLLSGVRTPIGRYRGSLALARPDDLAAHVLSAALERVPGAAKAVQEVCFGGTNQAGEDNRNVGRMAALLAGLPFEVTGSTTNRLCGSGMDALVNVTRGICLGDFDVAVAGGVESMTRAPYVMAKTSEGFSRRPPEVFDTTIGWRFSNPRMKERIPLESMGETAENIVERYGISRDSQDRFALQSHQRALAAWQNGKFKDEVVAVSAGNGRPGQVSFDQDESIRANSSMELLSFLKPVFRENGTVTAGNSSPLNDGAAALVVSSEQWAERHGLAPLARIVSWAAAGVDPRVMGLGPVPATKLALDRAGLALKDIDVIELNEAFAAQALACLKELDLDDSRVNVNGGAIALGHPIGCTGARIVVTLAHELKRREARYGLATLCIGVGQGMAIIIERV